MSLRPVILCGGDGQRLWPESRKKLPKQFIKFSEKNNLFEETLSRIKLINYHKSPIIVANEEHRFYIYESLKKNSIDAINIFEPIGKNTTAAIYLSAKISGPDDELLIIPSDQDIKQKNIFSRTVLRSFKEKKSDVWVIFGVKPLSPHTGYGYINVSDEEKFQNQLLKDVIDFKEKPKLEIAKKYLKKGYLWNAGIFMCNSKTIIKSIRKYAPEISKKCDNVLKELRYSNDKKSIFFDFKQFDKIPSRSIDYSVIEKEKKIVCAPLSVKWSDLGNWDNLSDHLKVNQDQKKKIVQIDSRNNFIRSSGRVISTIGINDTIIVDTKDALLISKRNNTEKVKKIIAQLEKNNIFEAFENYFELRPWGRFENIFETSEFKIKKLNIYPKKSLSLQFHNFRSEHWFVIRGIASISLNNKEYKLKAGQSIDIPKKATHQIKNNTKNELIIVEIQLGTYFGEDDIIRLDDPYGR